MVAFTYAWWLTGDETAAVAAVRAATANPAVTAAAPDRRREVLLREVRATAAPTPTMCPASEVALLHDVHGLGLEEAAGLAAVDPADARTELAHGRLEALLETVIDPFVHPERIGGLAVSNPADVAHARQCDNCAQARALLEQGRAELRLLGSRPVPEALARWPDLAEARGTAEPAAETETAEPAEATGTAGTVAPGRTRRRLLTVALAAVAVLATVLLIAGDGGQGTTPSPASDAAAPGQRRHGGLSTGSTPAPAQSSDQPGESEPTGAPSGESVEDDAEPGAQDDGAPGPDGQAADVPPEAPPLTPPEPLPPVDQTAFAVESAALITPAGEPLPPGTVLAPDQQLRLALRTRGGEGTVTVAARWVVEGVEFRHVSVDLTAPGAAHVFGEPAPPEGWPPGTHEVFLSAQGAVVAVVSFHVG